MRDPKAKIFRGREKISKSAFAWLMIFFVLPAFLVSQSWAGRVISPAPSGKAAAPPSGISPAPPGKAAPPPLVSPSHTLAVMSKTTFVDAGKIQTGDFFAIFVFTIGGDFDKVAMFLEASDLYKGGDPMDPGKVGPIALNTGKPAEIMAEFGAGSRNTAFWRGAGNPISGYPSKKTETLIYGSGPRGHFSQDVSCKIWYTQPVAAKPAGQYSGVVRLNTMVAP
jgi:hypothetical protein